MALPYDRYVYPRVPEVIAHLWTMGTPVIVSDGDPVFQSYKIQSSGLAEAVRGNVLLYIHKEQHLDEIQQRYPARLYLMVDDKERILNALKSIFRANYHVFTATDGAQALDFIKKFGVHVVVSDQRMPGMTGVELLREARKQSPRTVRLLLTGYSDLAAMVGSINDGEVFRFVKKPWDNDEIREILAEATALAIKARAATAPRRGNMREASLLVIDPGQGLAKGLERLIAGSAKVHLVATPREGAKLLQHTDVAAVIADLAAGKDDLVSLFRLLKAKRPETLSILVASDPDADVVAALINHGQIYRFMAKPVSGRELRSYVSEALRRYAATRTKPAQKPAGSAQGVGAQPPRLARGAA